MVMLNSLTKVLPWTSPIGPGKKELTRRDISARYLNHIIADIKKQKWYYLQHITLKLQYINYFQKC
jgi:hypothetical protein